MPPSAHLPIPRRCHPSSPAGRTRTGRTGSGALRLALLLIGTAALAACAALPSAGPSSADIRPGGSLGIRVVDVDDAVTRRLAAQRADRLFSEVFPEGPARGQIVRPGDVLEVSVWEAPPTVLFSSGIPLATVSQGENGPASSGASGTSSNVTTLPQQMVDAGGTIYVPFAGAMTVTGKSPTEIESDIARQLQGKANKPQVLVRLVANNTAYVTIVGEVANSTRMPLTPRGEHLLDALAAAGGTKGPVDKTTLQLTRDTAVHSLPLDTVIRDPHQNIALQPGDVITALFQPLSFTALGATGKNDEVNFEAKGISLAQALARSGALIDTRSSPQGVFIFRFESPATVPEAAPSGTAPAPVPVIYRVDLRDPRAFFLAQNFPMQNKDVLYVSNAPAAQLQKFVNLLVSTIYPIQGVVTLTK
jgi:polysaccharide export outer membrane protein